LMFPWVCHVVSVIGEWFGSCYHEWERLPDHPMHHRCAKCKEEIWDWVW
jgi:hypothetical protein